VRERRWLSAQSAVPPSLGLLTARSRRVSAAPSALPRCWCAAGGRV